MRTRLPGNPDFDYQVARSNFRWPDHIERLLMTGAAIAWLTPESACDPACGDGTVLYAANRLRPIEHNYLSDISAPSIEALDFPYPHEKRVARIEDALADVFVDVVVLTEILEHLEDPDSVLALARKHASRLVASSPIGERPEHGNPEHLWGWDIDGYGEMLSGAGWSPTSLSTLRWPGGFYEFGIWTAQ